MREILAGFSNAVRSRNLTEMEVSAVRGLVGGLGLVASALTLRIGSRSRLPIGATAVIVMLVLISFGLSGRSAVGCRRFNLGLVADGPRSHSRHCRVSHSRSDALVGSVIATRRSHELPAD